jgi:hypothetical protein
MRHRYLERGRRGRLSSFKEEELRIPFRNLSRVDPLIKEHESQSVDTKKRVPVDYICRKL